MMSNFLFHTIFHSYYPDLSEFKQPVRRSSLRKTNNEVKNLYSSQNLTQPLPSLPFSQRIHKFFNKFKFQYSDVNDDEYLKLSI